jgi:hypothetical protein
MSIEGIFLIMVAVLAIIVVLSERRDNSLLDSNPIGLKDSDCEDTVSIVEYSTASETYKVCYDYIINTDHKVSHAYGKKSSYRIGDLTVARKMCWFDSGDICWGLSRLESNDLYELCSDLMELQIYMDIPC